MIENRKSSKIGFYFNLIRFSPIINLIYWNSDKKIKNEWFLIYMPLINYTYCTLLIILFRVSTKEKAKNEEECLLAELN